MFKFPIEHKVLGADGICTGRMCINLVRNLYNEDDDDGDDVFQFDFFDNVAGSKFNRELTRDSLRDMCMILFEPDELNATLEIAPTIEVKGDMTVAAFSVAGRHKSYPIYIWLEKAYVASDAEKILDLKTENSDLCKQIASLEAHIDVIDNRYGELANSISVIAHHLLTMSCERQYTPHLAEYPGMIVDHDVHRPFNAVRNLHILTDVEYEPVFKAMVDAHMPQPLVDMVCGLEVWHSVKSVVIAANIKYLVDTLTPSQMKSSRGITMLEHIDARVELTTHSANEFWIHLKDIIARRIAEYR